MTAFDAAVFDLVRIALRHNFFGLIAYFGGKHEKVSLEDIGEAGSFESFRDTVVDQQLKKRYLKDLLILLNNHGVSCVDESVGDRFIQIIEMILRRNVHVHNRGTIDEAYLQAEPGGEPRFNLYNLNPGQTARIDEDYWEMANRLCSNCVERLKKWAAG
jgi:hypothetical protein